MGLQVVREAATAANEASDGTSTATLLADAIVREGVRYVTAGSDHGPAPRHRRPPTSHPTSC